jgi:hypothetical protein
MGWFLVTILLPLIAPLIGSAIYRIFPIPNKPLFLDSVISTIKDGQLCWAALAFCCSALYEIDVPPEGGTAIIAAANAGKARFTVTLLLIIAGMIAAGGAAFPTDLACPQGEKWAKHYEVMVASFGITGLSAIGYALIHYGIFS